MLEEHEDREEKYVVMIHDQGFGLDQRKEDCSGPKGNLWEEIQRIRIEVPNTDLIDVVTVLPQNYINHDTQDLTGIWGLKVYNKEDEAYPIPQNCKQTNNSISNQYFK